MRTTFAVIATTLAAMTLGTGSAKAAVGDLSFSNCIEHSLTPTGICGGNTGTLTVPRDLTIGPEGTSAYSPSSTGDYITQYSRNPATGALTYVTCYEDAVGTICPDLNDTPGLDGAFSVAISPDGLSLYAIGNAEDSIVEFARNPANGQLTFTPGGACIDDEDTGTDAGCTSTGKALDGPSDVEVSPDGKSVYVSSLTDAALAHFDRTDSGVQPSLGALTLDADDPCEGDMSNPENGCSTTVPSFAQPIEIAITPNGASVYVADLMMDGVAIFDRDTVTDPGDLTADDCIQDTAAAGCASETAALNRTTSVNLSPDGASLYATSENDSALVTFKVLAGGQLQPVPPCYEDVDDPMGNEGCIDMDGFGVGALSGPTGPNAVAISPDGLSAYVAAGLQFGDGDDAITIFSRDPATGALTRTGCIDDTTDGNPACSASLDLLSGVSGVVMGSNSQVYAVAVIDEAITTFAREPVPPVVTPTPTTVTPVVTPPVKSRCKKKGKKRAAAAKKKKCKKKKRR